MLHKLNVFINVIHTLGPGIQMIDPFGCFLTDFNEIFRISFFRPGGLNGAVRSDLTPLQFLKFHVPGPMEIGNWRKTTKWIHHLYTWPQGVDDIFLSTFRVLFYGGK